MESLAAVLERHKLDSMLREAEIIRDFPDDEERLDEARKMIRFVLYEFALSKIDAATRDQLLNVLHFATERPNVIHEQPIATHQDEGM